MKGNTPSLSLGVKIQHPGSLKLSKDKATASPLCPRVEICSHMRRNKFHCCSGLRHSSPSPALQHCWTYSCDLIRWFPLATGRHITKHEEAVTHRVPPSETLGYNCFMFLVYWKQSGWARVQDTHLVAETSAWWWRLRSLSQLMEERKTVTLCTLRSSC